MADTRMACPAPLTRLSYIAASSSLGTHGSADSADSIGGPRQYQKQVLEHLTSYLRATCEAQ